MRVLTALMALSPGAFAQCDVAEIFAGDADPGDGFGASVSLSGDRLLVGAPHDDQLAPNAGAAYLFERQGTAWVEVQKLVAPGAAAGDVFGTSVSLDGDRAAVGAPLRGVSNNGSVFVFERQLDGTWLGAEVYTASGLQRAGAAVSLDGDRVYVGRPGSFSDRGDAVVLLRSGGSWILEHWIQSGGPHQGAEFGVAVSLSGDRVAIGAPYPDELFNPPLTLEGSVYVYEKTPNDVWILDAALSLPGDMLNHFGVSVAMEGNLLVVGAEAEAPAGAAYVYRRQVNLWVQVARARAALPLPGSRFGHAVSVSGSRFAVGAPDVDGGRVYLFEEDGGFWLEKARYEATDSTAGDSFGVAVALSDFIAAGASRDDSGCGVAGCDAGSIYEVALPSTCRPPLGTSSCFGTGCPCANDDPQAGCVNSTGHGALLTAGGSTSVSSDDLTLAATGCPPDNSGLFFMGASVGTPVIVGDGLACTGGLFRFFPSTVSPGGQLTLANVASSAPVSQIHPGDVRHFQAWTRDVLCGPPPSPCATPCGGGSNLSNALTLVFAP